MKLLQIDTSILGEQSVSRQLTSSVIRQLSTAYPDAEIIHHDFALEPILICLMLSFSMARC